MGDILDEIQQIIFTHSINDEPFLYLYQEIISEEDEWTLPELDISLLMI
ncbi:Uncharacterised protein [[Pasteurella] aerogenes]|nr:Uncharacterised protein [[Pasteurella] aerogenes]